MMLLEKESSRCSAIVEAIKWFLLGTSMRNYWSVLWTFKLQVIDQTSKYIETFQALAVLAFRLYHQLNIYVRKTNVLPVKESELM